MAGERPGGWNDERIARELEAWFAHHAFACWPTYRAFAADGHKRLHAAVMRAGGPERWALELGVPVVAHRGGPGLTEDEVDVALRALLRAHRPERFPTLDWVGRHGPPGLAAAVRRTGGSVHWAHRLNVPAPKHARWSDELIESELRRLFPQHTRWPTRRDFEVAGATGLRRAVYAGRGSSWWAQRLGLSTEALRPRRRTGDSPLVPGPGRSQRLRDHSHAGTPLHAT